MFYFEHLWIMTKDILQAYIVHEYIFFCQATVPKANSHVQQTPYPWAHVPAAAPDLVMHSELF